MTPKTHEELWLFLLSSPPVSGPSVPLAAREAVFCVAETSANCTFDIRKNKQRTKDVQEQHGERSCYSTPSLSAVSITAAPASLHDAGAPSDSFCQ
ncbi:hypothetical protein AV530_008206 [Patagioenas fasciata monilis]|uniref:Uncharacterized protein n=1 Tax=Patagioenas fasciata monilis TaxID=372326 RepID=A0A1V4KV45_PATFA|nr:hypothetical protein AV530_008206 [Patagioenas fasciata monilis]